MLHKLSIILVSVLCIMCLTGCSDALQQEAIQMQSDNMDIKITVDGEVHPRDNVSLTWVELDQLDTFKDLREVWDDKMQVVRFDSSSKNGVLYVNSSGDWEGNNTLYDTYQNKAFHDLLNTGEVRSAIAQAAIKEFTDVEDENKGTLASINAYYNIIPTNNNKSIGLDSILSRAEAMSAICRGDTQVVQNETNSDFVNTVGENEYNPYAQNVLDNSYLDYTNGSLCYDTYNSAITKAEAVYMLITRHYSEEYENTADNINSDFSDCSNCGDLASKLGIKDGHAWQAYELEYCLKTSNNKCPKDLYKALAVAYNHGIINSTTEWNKAINGFELLQLMINTYDAVYRDNEYPINVKIGKNTGESLITAKEEKEEQTEVNEQQIDTNVVSQVRDVTNLDDLFKIYGEEINMTEEEKQQAYETASHYTFEAADVWMEVAHCKYLNVRTGPSTDYNILKSIPSGTKCHIVAVCKETGWYRIIADNKVVYQCGVYFQNFEGSENYLMKTGDNANDW